MNIWGWGFYFFFFLKIILHTYSPTSPEEKPFPCDYKKTDGDNNTSREIPKDEETELPGSERTKLPEARRSELPGGTETDLPGDKGTELPIDGGAQQPEAGTEQPRGGTEPTGGGTDENGKEGRKGSRAVSQVEIEGSTPQVFIVIALVGLDFPVQIRYRLFERV